MKIKVSPRGYDAMKSSTWNPEGSAKECGCKWRWYHSLWHRILGLKIFWKTVEVNHPPHDRWYIVISGDVGEFDVESTIARIIENRKNIVVLLQSLDKEEK